MTHVAVTAVGVDRPGIVAAVTGVLKDEGCNLEDTSMTILRGHFAMMLVVEIPPDASPSLLEAALAPVGEQLRLVLTVRPVDEGTEERTGAAPAGEQWAVAVYGADRPGIVHAVATVLSGVGANITDLTTRVIGESGHPVYAMHLDVVVPAGVDAGALADHLSLTAAELGVDVSIHPAEADIL
ncbi:MAG TPA: ACT domain-containing protein [Acidimicrobiales bacterium]